jgi:hypothetical protein
MHNTFLTRARHDCTSSGQEDELEKQELFNSLDYHNNSRIHANPITVELEDKFIIIIGIDISS